MKRWRFRLHLAAIMLVAAVLLAGGLRRARQHQLTAAEWKLSVAGRGHCRLSVTATRNSSADVFGEDAVAPLLADLPGNTRFGRDRSGILEAGGVALYYQGPPNMMAWVYPDKVVVRDDQDRFFRSTAPDPSFATLHAKLRSLCPAVPAAPVPVAAGAGP